jgi:hypothetical protein
MQLGARLQVTFERYKTATASISICSWGVANSLTPTAVEAG